MAKEVKPQKVEATEVKPPDNIQPRLTGKPQGKTGNIWLRNLMTNRDVSLPANIANELVRTKPNEYVHI